jgi:hypothetical protein
MKESITIAPDAKLTLPIIAIQTLVIKHLIGRVVVDGIDNTFGIGIAAAMKTLENIDYKAEVLVGHKKLEFVIGKANDIYQQILLSESPAQTA